MVKLICLDMDGTLLDDDLKISGPNREAIDLARQRGIAVTIATGRMFASALIYARELAIDIPLITMNGAMIKHPRTEAKLVDLSIGRSRLEEVIRIITDHGYRPNFYDEFNLYVGEGLQRYYHTSVLAGLDDRYRIQTIDEEFTYQQLIEEAGATINKGIFFPSAEDRPILRDRLAGLGGLAVVASSPTNLEITHQDADKGKGILTLGRHLGIDPAQIMVIGDSDNDRSMLQVAGYPVVMGNAAAELHELACFVTDDNNHHGVARAIRKIALGEIC